MPAASGSSSGPDFLDRPPIVDVWSRTSPKYRRRSLLLLAVNLGLFVGLCVFAFWLRTGQTWPGDPDRYGPMLTRSFSPTDDEQVTLVDLVLFPVSVREVPMQIVVMGLLLATLATMPLLTTLLYRLPAALLFVAAIAFVAMMPWLSLSVLAGCALIALRPLGMSFKYALALLGLLPVIVYFFFATRVPESSPTALIQPDVKVKLYAPWVLAIVASAVILAVVLGIAKLINYRPGGISPLLAVLLVVPIVLFQVFVGADELEYRLLEYRFGPGSTEFFVPRELGETLEALAYDYHQRHPAMSPAASRQRIAGRLESQLRIELAEQQYLAAGHCQRFLEQFPNSAYLPNVHYLAGRALDMRLDLSRYRHDEPRAEYYDDVPGAASREHWSILAARYSASPFAAVALVKQAVVAGRNGRLDAARRLLSTAIATFDDAAPQTQPIVGGLRQLFARETPESSLKLDPQESVVEARGLRELIDRNAEPPASPGALPAVSQLLRLDARHPLYEANLRRLVRRYPDSKLADNLRVRLATCEPSLSRRIERLAEAAARYAATDAGPAALFALADAYRRDARPDDAQAVYRRLVERYPESCWAVQARRLPGVPSPVPPP